MSSPAPEIPTAWTTGFTDVLNTGSWRAALPVHAWRPSPCHSLCPVGGSIPRWVRQIAAGDYAEAWLTLAENNPLPAVTGRVCHHPCESECNRAEQEGAVGVNALEHFLADLALERGWSLPLPAADQDRTVGVVGGGPAGLAAAYHLRRLGYPVTIYEARPQLGGLLRYGIPAYRLPPAVLRQELDRLLALGIAVRLSTPVADAQGLARLEQEHDAVFIAVGAQRAKPLPQLAGGAEHGLPIFDGLEFLAREDAEAAGAGDQLGERVLVVGGGSAALDVARSARRLGKQVTILCLEERAAMPAQPEEVTEALEEGVGLFDGALLQTVERTPDRGLVLSCRRCTLDPAAPAGVLRPLPIAGSEFSLQADSVIVSIGQEAALESFHTILSVEETVLRVDPVTLATERPGVFAGGDVASLRRYVSEALGDGRRAARGIAAYLGHPQIRPDPAAPLEEAVRQQAVNFYYFAGADRHEKSRLAASERLADFREVAQALSAAEAMDEAARCLSCGTCIECDNCFYFCPDMAVRRDPLHPQHYVVDEQYCKGCGLCAAECPRGVIRMTQETR